MKKHIANGIVRRGSRRGAGPGTVRRMAAATASVLAIAGLAVTSAASSSALAAPRTAQPMIPVWRIVKQVHSGSDSGFSLVIAAGKNGGWAFNRGSGTSGPTAWRRSGSTWTQVAFPGKSDEFVVAAKAISPSDVWVFTASLNQSRVLRWDGHTWTVKRTFTREIAGAAVISPNDIWVFGQPFFPGPGLGAWHYDGRTWTRVASGHDLEGGSALSANNVWAFDGTDVAHWNGSTWSRTSVASLLPAKQLLNDPMLTGILALSSHNVYAIANGFLQDEGGPMVVLHWDGHQWSKVAAGNYGFGSQPLQQAQLRRPRRPVDPDARLRRPEVLPAALLGWAPDRGRAPRRTEPDHRRHRGPDSRHLWRAGWRHHPCLRQPGRQRHRRPASVRDVRTGADVRQGGLGVPGARTGFVRSKEFTERPFRYLRCKAVSGLLAGCNDASVPAWQRTGDGT